MSEQEMLQEIERLRRELAKVREDRNHLHKTLCQMLPVEEIQLTEEDLRKMREEGATIVDLLHDPRFDEIPPANGAKPMGSTKALQH